MHAAHAATVVQGNWRQVKWALALAAGVALVLVVVIVGMAWVKGGVQPAQTVDIPLKGQGA